MVDKASTIDRIARPIKIATGAVTLEGDLAIPDGARGIVLFAHGSGSSRHSPRNRFVAETLDDGGLATLLFDLLTRGGRASGAVHAPSPLRHRPAGRGGSWTPPTGCASSPRRAA